MANRDAAAMKMDAEKKSINDESRKDRKRKPKSGLRKLRQEKPISRTTKKAAACPFFW